MQTLTKLTLLTGLLTLAACGTERVTTVENCSIEETELGIELTCNDTTRLVRHGEDGLDGTNGLDGISPVLEVIDPCGDNPNKPDEILFLLDDGLAAWYKDLGLVLLEDGNYMTTDEQACRFSVVNGEYVE